MKRIAVYLAGNIQKSHADYSEDYWMADDLENIVNTLSPIAVDFFNPSERTDNLSDQKSVFGRDMTQVYLADVIFVDARQRRGLGVGAEMMWARMHGKPIVTWAPKETYYRKSNTKVIDQFVKNFTHPFIENLSDFLAESVEEGAGWIRDNIANGQYSAPDSMIVHDCMTYYYDHYLKVDEPMQKLVNNSSAIKNALAKE